MDVHKITSKYTLILAHLAPVQRAKTSPSTKQFLRPVGKILEHVMADGDVLDLC